MAFIRQFKTKSGAIGVQICTKQHQRIVKTIHIGSANSDGELTLLLKRAQEIINRDKTPLFDLSEFDIDAENREV